MPIANIRKNVVLIWRKMLATLISTKLAKNLTFPLEQYLIKIGRNPEAWFFFEFGQLFDKFYFFDLCFQAQNLQHPIW